MTHALVTGCAGFIGSHLCEALLAGGWRVTGIDNFDPFYSRLVKENNLREIIQHPGFRLIEGDVCDIATLKDLPDDFDIVIHLAARAGVLPSVQNPGNYIRANITATGALLEWMKTAGLKKLVFASSSSVYGNTSNIPFREDEPVNKPVSPYAATKAACELLNYTYHHLYDFDILNLRLFTVYGPRQRPDLAIHKFVRLIDSGKPVMVYGDGSTARDYTFIDDILTGILGAVDYVMQHTGVFEIINLGNHQPVKLLELIQLLGSLMERTPDIRFKPMQPGDVLVTYADISKAGKLLGYKPSTSIKAGLKQFIRWYYEQKDKGVIPVV